MPGVLLWGWCTDPEGWVKVLVNADGKLIIDPSEIFENPPTEDEAGKAPTSEWAYDHDADPNAHHNQAHTLASHSTKAHAELSDAPEDAHHTKFTATEHTAIGDAAPHHAQAHEDTHKLGGADEIDSPLGIAAMADLANTKIWQGDATNRPTPVDLPAVGAQLIVAETEVFNGTSPTSWTDLDLSGTIGSQATLVILKAIRGATDPQTFAFRKNGDTDEFYAFTGYGYGLALSDTPAAGVHAVFLVFTDTNGVVEWRTRDAGDAVIDIMGYIK